MPRGIFTVFFHEPYTAEPPANAADPKITNKLNDNSGKIRCRHIIQKFLGVKNAQDNVRRKAITRTQDEAEKKLREVLLKITTDIAEFPKIAREISECQSCLKVHLFLNKQLN
jgi:hypothetical protein